MNKTVSTAKADSGSQQPLPISSTIYFVTPTRSRFPLLCHVDTVLFLLCKLSGPFYKDCAVLLRVWRKVKEKLLLGLDQSVPSIFQTLHDR